MVEHPAEYSWSSYASNTRQDLEGIRLRSLTTGRNLGRIGDPGNDITGGLVTFL
jgi:hypothetical protein